MRSLAYVVGALAIAAVPAMSFADLIVIGSGDIAWDQSDTDFAGRPHNGYDVRIRYSAGDNAYFLNGAGGSGSEFIAGLDKGLTEKTNATWFLEWSGAKFVRAETAGTQAILQWAYDFSSAGVTVTNATVIVPTSVFCDPSLVDNSIQWQVSTDGTTWNTFKTITSNHETFHTNGGQVSDGDAIFDLTSWVAGTTGYSIRAVIDTHEYNDKVQLFRQHDLDMRVSLEAVPEPMSVGLLGLGGLLLLARRR